MEQAMDECLNPRAQDSSLVEADLHVISANGRSSRRV